MQAHIRQKKSNHQYRLTPGRIFRVGLAYALVWAMLPALSPGYGPDQVSPETGSLRAQGRDVSRPRPRPRPVIFIQDPRTQKKVPLKMHALDVDVKVVGNLATTTMQMTFYNDNNRVLEGRFYFPLGEGQTVSRFGLDIGGKIREGVVVEKAKGREVFEKIVRQNIDPGLLEWTKGNNFKSRIYPIPARGYRKVLVAYEQELKDKGDGFLYTLPLAFQQAVDKFHLKTEVYKQQVQPRLGRENELVNFRFKKWRESYIAEVKKTNYKPNQQLGFLLPRTQAYRKTMIEADGARKFFYLHLIPRIHQAAKVMPKTIHLVWDASGSGANRDLNKELKLIDAYFKKVGNAKIKLSFLRNAVSSRPELYALKDGKWESLYYRLKRVAYDGGTQLGALDLTAFKADEIILSSDGVSNFGKAEIKTGSTPIMVLNSAQTAQHSYLNFLAQKTGGVYVNLNTTTSADALAALSNQSYSFLKAVYKDGTLAQTYPSIPTRVQGDFSLAGILRTKKTSVTLHFGFGSKTKYTQTFELDGNKLSTSGLVRRVWAQKKIKQLDMQFEKNEAELTRLGKEFSIVTRNTSLIVLERIEDYVTNRILPPEELRNKYYALINQEEKQKKKVKEDHILTVVRRFNALQEWYNKDYPRGRKFVEKKPKKSANAESNTEEPRRAREEERRPVTNGQFNGGGNGRNSADSDETISRLKKDKAKSGKSAEGGIELQKWDPKTPYLAELKKTPKKELYSAYIRLKAKYAKSSSFYLDVADFFIGKQEKELGLRILSNIAEMELQNHQLLRILGHRLAQLNYLNLSALVFEEVLKMREEEPQSYRDLALVYSRKVGDVSSNQRAAELLYKVISTKWDGRFPDIEIIALHELNSIIARNPGVTTKGFDKRLLRNMPVDVRVVLNWDADLTDMDLWVTDPFGEKCFYSHPRTYIGGFMSRDFTRGYGPEIYMIRKAQDGDYNIEVNYYGNRQQVLAGATTVQVVLYLNYGRKNQTRKEITLRLKDKKEIVKIGKFRIGLKK